MIFTRIKILESYLFRRWKGEKKFLDVLLSNKYTDIIDSEKFDFRKKNLNFVQSPSKNIRRVINNSS